MKINKFFFNIYILLLLIFPLTANAVHQLEIYSKNEQAVIKKHLLANIATKENSFNKNNQIRSIPGAVLASPSNGGPGFSQDYQFHWTRDAALTMQYVLRMYKEARGEEKAKLRDYLINYVNFERIAQKQPSKPGEETLGQPKFNIDATVWEGEWGRPQNDGPALRVIALLEIAKQFLKEGHKELVSKKILPMIELDLAYLSTHWQEKGYGLWEEVFDKDHFFNKALQRRAFSLAAEYYFAHGRENKAKYCQAIAASISLSLQDHWNEALGYYSETIHQQYYKGGGLNSSVLLASLYADDFSVVDDKIMSTVYYLRNVFASLYKMNLDDHRHAPLLGRYVSDIYDGDQFTYGNPWVLISHAMAEYYYRLAYYYWSKNEIKVTSTNIYFFNQIHSRLVSKPEVIIYMTQPQQFQAIMNALIDEGDRYLESVKRFAACEQDDCLHFAEQIDRKTGKPVSAKDLSWSYVTLLSALDWRDRVTAVV